MIEYKTVVGVPDHDLERQLNQRSQEGWELHSVIRSATPSRVTCIFERLPLSGLSAAQEIYDETAMMKDLDWCETTS